MKLCLTITALVSFYTLVLATPALAQDKAHTVVMPTVVIKPCVARPLEQGSGSVRICKAGQL